MASKWVISYRGILGVQPFTNFLGHPSRFAGSVVGQNNISHMVLFFHGDLLW